MTTTRQIDLVINKLTKAQYEGTTPNADEFYVLTDDIGITSADIISALGYTPYNATNPNGYVTALTLNNYAQKEALQTSFYSANINADGLYVDGITGLDGNVTCYANLSVEGTFTVDNKTLASVAFSGDFDDLTNQPTIGDGTVTITQGGVTKGTFTLNQSGNVTINLDAGGGGTITVDQVYDSTSANAQSGVAIAGAGFLTSISSSDVTSALGYTPYNSSNPNGYITSSALNGYATQAWVGQQGYLTSSSISNMQTTGNLVTSISSSSTDSQYPSAKCMYDIIGDIETLLQAV